MSETQDQEQKKLTKKETIFCHEYVVDWNGSRAARAAGYSEKTATVIAYENLRKPHIKAYLEEIQEDLAKLAGVSALRNVQELKKLAYTNLSDFKNGWMTEKDFEELTDEQKAALSEIQHTTKTFEGGTERIVKFKLHDKMRAIDMMNKMLGFNSPDKVDHTTNGDKINNNFTYEVVKPK